MKGSSDVLAHGHPFQLVLKDGTNAVVMGGKVVHVWVEGERVGCGPPTVWDLGGDGESQSVAGKRAVAARMQAAGVESAPRRVHSRRPEGTAFRITHLRAR